ncbi:MAG: CHAT domain-containing protein [Planctomycetota bacterium]
MAELGSPHTSARARAELTGRLTEWRELDYGLGDPLDGELVLAATTALAAMSLEAARAEELLLVLRWIEERLHDSSGAGDADLALSLAQGWKAVLATPGGTALSHEERLSALRSALSAAAFISAEERRDGFGCALARLAREELLALGRSEEARELLAAELARFPADLEVRPFLLCQLADDARIAQDWPMAQRALEEAEASAELLSREFPGRETALVRRWAAGARCRLELALGLIDRAAEAYAAEQLARREGASDVDSTIAVLFDGSSLALAAARPELLERTRSELAGALADEEFLRDVPAVRAQLWTRLELLTVLRQAARAAPFDLAPLELAGQDPELDPAHAASVDLVLLAYALTNPDLHPFAQRSLARLKARTGSPLPPEVQEGSVAGEVLMALRSGARGAELDRLERELAPALEGWARRRATGPVRSGGLGYLTYRSRRMLLAARLELDLAREDERAEERAIDHFLPVQELGSLARVLGATSGSVSSIRQELLSGRRAVLLYLPGFSELHVFLIERERVTHERVPWSYEFEAVPVELARLLVTSPARLTSSERAERLRALADGFGLLGQRLLPAALHERLAPLDELYVVDSGLLWDLPLEALPLGGHPLGQELALAYLPSVPVGLELERRARVDSRPRPFAGLLVTTPTLSESARRGRSYLVPFELEEAQRRALGASRRDFRTLENGAATLSGLRAALEKDKPSFLDLLAHGVHDPRLELGAGLALAPEFEGDDGLVWLEELAALNFVGPPLVALATCQSARGPRRVGDDGLALLSGVFFSAGTRCLLQSAQALALEPTIELLAQVTSVVAEGGSPAGALRDARRKLADQDEWADPFYWAPLRVVGLGFAPLHPLPPR